MNRPHIHFLQFCISEVSPVCRLSADGQTLTIAGVFESAALGRTVEAYVGLFVECWVCRSRGTDMWRDREVRRFVVECRDCKGRRAVEGVSKGARQAEKTGRRMAA